jgi:antitoxin (DNA-binding transcriptional repressor) of toxin-antitoxin stability system
MAGVVHISEEEAARDFAGLFERVRAGERVVVEAPGRCGVMLVPNVSEPGPGTAARSADRVKGRTVTEIMKRLDEWESVHGVLVMDKDFADDVQVAHDRLNQPMDSSKWD